MFHILANDVFTIHLCFYQMKLHYCKGMRENGCGKVYHTIYNSYPFHIDNRVMSKNEVDFVFKEKRKSNNAYILSSYRCILYAYTCNINGTLYNCRIFDIILYIYVNVIPSRLLLCCAAEYTKLHRSISAVKILSGET